MQKITELLDVAKFAAKKAGDVVLDYYNNVETKVHMKQDNSPITQADIAAHNAIVSVLKKTKLPIMSEESVNDAPYLDSKYVWIVDPLDGTHEFINKEGEFCVMIGLIESGKPILGVVHQPTTDTMHYASLGGGTWRMENNKEATRINCSKIKATRDASVALSRSHRLEKSNDVAAALGVKNIQSIGSVGLKICAIASQNADIYYNLSPFTSEWDTCAPEILLFEAGGTMTDCFGNSLQYNQYNPKRLRGITATNGPLHNIVIEHTKAIF